MKFSIGGGRGFRPRGSRSRSGGTAAEKKTDSGQPIKVSRAEASVPGDMGKRFLELRDAGHPGSTYALFYDSRSDRLTGIYL